MDIDDIPETHIREKRIGQDIQREPDDHWRGLAAASHPVTLDMLRLSSAFPQVEVVGVDLQPRPENAGVSAMTTKIEWADATWNPVTGCTRVSSGCANCYIERTPPMRIAGRRFVKGAIPVQLHLERLEQPLRWRKPRRMFVNSMSDLFHEDVPFDFIDKVFAVMALADTHTFQILTKRPERMRMYFEGDGTARGREGLCGFEAMRIARNRGEDIHHPYWDVWWEWPLPNVWLGVSVEDQKTADERLPHLLDTPAAVRFVSYEPALGPVDFTNLRNLGFDALYGVADRTRKIDWLIVGGESGPGARPMHPGWARSARDQCQAAGVPFFFKQWGEWRHESENKLSDEEMKATWIEIGPDGKQPFYKTRTDRDVRVYRVGKKKAGAMLDGREWREFPRTEREPAP